ncbi:hypothetical protein BDQ17DRAFT_1330123 [Cyathus striatus]|nr:hypothetical protein BDQ17DRAFT_1330123 [Cyathus striatus]
MSKVQYADNITTHCIHPFTGLMGRKGPKKQDPQARTKPTATKSIGTTVPRVKLTLLPPKTPQGPSETQDGHDSIEITTPAPSLNHSTLDVCANVNAMLGISCSLHLDSDPLDLQELETNSVSPQDNRKDMDRGGGEASTMGWVQLDLYDNDDPEVDDL